MAILPEAIYRLKAIPSKIPMMSFLELVQIFLKFVGRHTRPSIDPAWPKQRRQLELPRSQASDQTTKLQKSKQPCTGTETDTELNGKGKRAQKWAQK